MFVRFRNVDRKVHRILHREVPVRGDAQQVSPPGLAFHHIGNGLFIQFLLGQHADHQRVVLDQADGPVLQFARGVSLGMDIADFLHLQAAFQADRVIQPPADEEDVMRVGHLGGEPLQPFLFLQDPRDLVRNLGQLRQHAPGLFPGDLAPYAGQVDGQHIRGNQLGAVGLGGGHGDFRARQRIEHMVRFPGDRRTDYVHDGQRDRAPLLRDPQSCQAVRRLPGLGNDDYKRFPTHGDIPVAEFGGQFHPDRNSGQIFDHILGRHPHMPGRSAGDDIDLFNRPDILFRQSRLGKVGFPVLHDAVQRIPDRGRLFVDFLEHEMLVAALFRRFGVPGDLRQGKLHLVPVQVVEQNLSGRNPGHLQVVDIVNLPRIFQDGRHVGRQVRFPVRHTKDHRGILPRRENLVREILEHQRQGIAAADTYHGPRDGVHRPDFVFLVVVIHKLDGHLGVRVAVEGVAVPKQFFLQFRIVFNDAVVHAHHIRLHRPAPGAGTVAAHMRMRVCHAGIPMGSPSGMPDPAASRQRPSLVRFICQVVQLPGSLDHLRQRRAVAYGQAGGIISPVFQPGKAVQQDRRGLLPSGESDYSAHMLSLRYSNKKQENELYSRSHRPVPVDFTITPPLCQYIIIH